MSGVTFQDLQRGGQDVPQGGLDYEDDDVPQVTPFYGIPNKNNHPDLIKWQLENEVILEAIEHDLRREKFDPRQKDWIKPKDSKQMLNEEGIYDVLAIFRSRTHKSFALTNFEKEDVYRIARQIKNEVAIKLYHNHKKYEVDFSDLDTIVNLIDQNAFAVLMKSYRDLQRKHLSETTTYSKVEQNVNNPQKNNNPLAGFGNFLRRG